MVERYPIGAVALAAALAATIAGARAWDEAKYPDLKGQWLGVGAGPDAAWDPERPAGRGQLAPLTPEYQALLEATLARAAAGGRPPEPCIPPGMPRSMIVYQPMEIIVTPPITYMVLGHMAEFRRIFTDGRKWSAAIEPAHAGFSTGAWEDTDGDGRYDTLAVETRGMKGPRTFDSSGIPLHRDNQTVVKERISLDRTDANLLHDEITTIDNALTRPWTVTRSYRRERNAEWTELVCPESNRTVAIGTETYAVSADGYLTPTRQRQPPPDLRHFPNRK